MPERKKEVEICQGPVFQGEPDDEVVALVACGDIGLYGKLEEKLLREGSSVILGDTIDVFKNADFVFGNLEGPVSDSGQRHNLPPPYPALRMNPKSISFLKEGGFDVVSLANNHMLDYGGEALLDTLERLDDAGILHFGAGNNEDSACAPITVNIQGIRIGFIGFHEGGAVAESDRPGACLFNKKNAISAIRKLRKRVDIVVVSFHFGFDYFTCPSPYHIRLCRRFIDEGADLILGHHPHVPQGVERYKNGLIAYSLGNFSFHLGEKAPERFREGFLLKVDFLKHEIRSSEVIPYELKSDLSLSLLKGAKKDKKTLEYKRLSETIKNDHALRREWYTNLRNFYLGYIVYYWKFDFRKGNILRFFQAIFKLFNLKKPSSIRLKSIFYFILSGYFIKPEIRKIISKLRQKNILSS